MTLFHYTAKEHWHSIKTLGEVIRSESNVGSPVDHWAPAGEHVGPDVVWLLDLPELETESHGLVGGKLDKRAVRLEVDVPGIRWVDWMWAHRMHPLWKSVFIDAGGGDEAAEHWYVWPHKIRRTAWRSATVDGLEELL